MEKLRLSAKSYLKKPVGKLITAWKLRYILIILLIIFGIAMFMIIGIYVETFGAIVIAVPVIIETFLALMLLMTDSFIRK